MRILAITLLSIFFTISAFAQQGKTVLTSKAITAKLAKCYDGELDAKQLAEQQFNGVTFRIDTERKVLYRVKKDKEKTFTYTWNEATGEMVLTDCPNCDEMKMTMKRAADGYEINFLEHTGDCFTFNIVF